jgi:hypothetical protein
MCWMPEVADKMGGKIPKVGLLNISQIGSFIENDCKKTLDSGKIGQCSKRLVSKAVVTLARGTYRLARGHGKGAACLRACGSKRFSA